VSDVIASVIAFIIEDGVIAGVIRDVLANEAHE